MASRPSVRPMRVIALASALALIAVAVWVTGHRTSPADVPQDVGAPATTPAPTAVDDQRLAPVRPGPGTRDFLTTGWTLVQLPIGDRPYAVREPTPLIDHRPRDAAGVLLFRLHDELHNHPVNQARYAIALLNSHELTGDPDYLEAGRRHVERLLAIAHQARGGLYFPYEFDSRRHANNSDPLIAPWYSAMAQGQALSALVRLHLATGEDRWREAADAVFASFLNHWSADEPWTVFVDDAGYLWLEEYPAPQGPDLTLNGHIFAIFGLYDYHLATGDARALPLIDGAITTVRHYIEDYRVEDGVSFYCLAHEAQHPGYHVTHTGQLRFLEAMTGDRYFGEVAELFERDFPDPRLTATALIQPGRHEGYRFNDFGPIQDRMILDVVEPTEASVTQRRVFSTRTGTWLEMDSGPFAGFWLRESPQVHLRGAIGRRVYDPPAALRLAPGIAHRGLRLDPAGGAHSATEVTLPAELVIASPERAVIDGVAHLLVDGGPLDGHWLPESPVAHVAGVADRSVHLLPGLAGLLAGAHRGFRFDDDGIVVEQAETQLKSAQSFATEAWAVINGEPHVLIGAGDLAGFWMREADTTLTGAIHFAAGGHTAYRFDDDGALEETRSLRLPAPSRANAAARITVDGRAYLAVADGTLAGWWVPESDLVELR